LIIFFKKKKKFLIGDIVQRNVIEIWVCILIMMTACMVFAYSMNTVG
jgi:hypothetical protein